MRMRRVTRGIEDAGRVAQDLVTALQTTWRRFPSAREPLLQKLIGRGFMIPDDDRRHGAESGGVVDEVPAAFERDQDVMSVLILREDGLDIEGRPPRTAPVQRAFESSLQGHCESELL